MVSGAQTHTHHKHITMNTSAPTQKMAHEVELDANYLFIYLTLPKYIYI